MTEYYLKEKVETSKSLPELEEVEQETECLEEKVETSESLPELEEEEPETEILSALRTVIEQHGPGAMENVKEYLKEKDEKLEAKLEDYSDLPDFDAEEFQEEEQRGIPEGSTATEGKVEAVESKVENREEPSRREE